MSFLERLLQSVQAKTEEEQQRQVREIIAAEVSREAKEDLTQEMEKKLQKEHQVRQARDRQRLEGVLKRFSVEERLEAIRDGVWKVGEIEPIIENSYTRYDAAGKPQLVLTAEPPLLLGYSLRYSYPAVIPRWEWGKAVVMETYSAVNGQGSYRIPQIVVTGYYEGENFDAIYIEADQSRDEVNLAAISRCEMGTEEERQFLQRPYDTQIYRNHSMLFLPGNYYPKPSPIEGFRINTPAILEQVVTDCCYEMIRNNRLPLQSEAEMQRQLVTARLDGRIKE